jgi:hypothetical protein
MKLIPHLHLLARLRMSELHLHSAIYLHNIHRDLLFTPLICFLREQVWIVWLPGKLFKMVAFMTNSIKFTNEIFYHLYTLINSLQFCLFTF